ncbi:MAG: hypothetical protein AB7E74_09125 [Pirellulales bacterium]
MPAVAWANRRGGRESFLEFDPTSVDAQTTPVPLGLHRKEHDTAD